MSFSLQIMPTTHAWFVTVSCSLSNKKIQQKSTPTRYFLLLLLLRKIPLPNSPFLPPHNNYMQHHPPHQQPAQEEHKQETMSTPPQPPPPPPPPVEGVACDFCEKWAALVHCRADDARLCLACDRHVHAANTVSSKHPRSLLCNACSCVSSTIFCSTHRLLFCHNCDFEAHKSDAAAHDRRPVEPFSGCPAPVELPDVLGVGVDEKGLLGLDGGDGDDYGSVVVRESWVWETPSVLSLDDLIVPTSVGHGYQAVGVPPPPKTRNLSCGKQKEEIIQQIRGMIQSEASMSNQFWKDEEDIVFQHLVEHERFQIECRDFNFSDATADVFTDYKDDASVWQNDCNNAINSVSLPYTFLPEKYTDNQPITDGQGETDSHTIQDDTVDTEDGHLIAGEDAQLLPTKYTNELSGPERNSAISRYREKRKTRRYDKQVRYESRKTRADGRVRIRGRFAKEVPNTKP